MCNKVRCESLARNDSFAGAYFRARTTFDAFVGIDVVDVAFRDSANGAFREASAASDTVVGDYVSHCCKVLEFILYLRCLIVQS